MRQKKLGITIPPTGALFKSVSMLRVFALAALVGLTLAACGGSSDGGGGTPAAGNALVAVWDSDDTLGDTIATDWDILFTRSTDGGATWSAPAALNHYAGTDAADDNGSTLVTDGKGVWIAAWSNDGMTWSMDGDIHFARSTNGGATWSDATPLNANATTDSGWDDVVTLAADGKGNWIAAWESADTLGTTIGTDFDILFARSSDGGATWSAPAALNTNADTDAGADYSVSVAFDGAGNLVAAWHSTDTLGTTIGTDADILVSRSSDGGASWSAPAALNTNAATDAGGDSNATLASETAGNWTATWSSNDALGAANLGTDQDILFAQSSDGGATWSDPGPLNTSAVGDTGFDNSVTVTLYGAGKGIAVWQSADTLGGTIGGDYDILTATTGDGGATWSAPAPLNTNAGSDAGSDQRVSLKYDATGNWVAAWETGENLGGTIGTDRDILFARSADGGATWSDPASLNSNATTDTGLDNNVDLAFGPVQ